MPLHQPYVVIRTFKSNATLLTRLVLPCIRRSKDPAVVPFRPTTALTLSSSRPLKQRKLFSSSHPAINY